MFTILGGDGKEYGPATMAQVRGWIEAGRANLDTKAKALGSDEWRRLGDFPEFGAAAAEPPPLEGATDSQPLAERWRRLLGAFVDGFLETLCWMPAGIAMMKGMRELAASGEVSDPSQLMPQFMPLMMQSMVHSLPYLAVLVIIQATLLSLRSQSVGNILVRTQIVRVTDGAPGGFLRAFLLRGALARVLRQVPFFGGLFWLVDTCFIFREDKRCLHDLIAGTKVVNI